MADSPWPTGKRCALSLTYDDALPVHHTQVAPLLADHGLRATFYINAHAGFTSDPTPWRNVAEQGHELGNHTLFHPCRREPAERFSWLAPHYDLCDYTAQRWTDEIRIANCLLQLIDGETERTYGNTCHNLTLGRAPHTIDLAPLILQHFLAGRGPGTTTAADPASVNFAAIGVCRGDGRTAADLIAEIEQARKAGRWLLYCFHGVGKGTHNGFIDTAEHHALIEFLGAQPDIWSASVRDVTRHLRASHT